ncbi:hypothetical protein K488DRAFT_70057 [Vararia minispora EC-137]|uniref:Uncharacterized protein n=1 Tax=Vararia minispora EC-137 TaxID=1314806 RepID=A0ACB8QMY0_9AGAM|nr:hypothetical protein K488DRAFT_70057 [Vararia minispora EC-137]
MTCYNPAIAVTSTATNSPTHSTCSQAGTQVATILASTVKNSKKRHRSEIEEVESASAEITCTMEPLHANLGIGAPQPKGRAADKIQKNHAQDAAKARLVDETTSSAAPSSKRRKTTDAQEGPVESDVHMCEIQGEQSQLGDHGGSDGDTVASSKRTDTNGGSAVDAVLDSAEVGSAIASPDESSTQSTTGLAPLAFVLRIASSMPAHAEASCSMHERAVESQGGPHDVRKPTLHSAAEVAAAADFPAANSTILTVVLAKDAKFYDTAPQDPYRLPPVTPLVEQPVVLPRSRSRRKRSTADLPPYLSVSREALEPLVEDLDAFDAEAIAGEWEKYKVATSGLPRTYIARMLSEDEMKRWYPSSGDAHGMVWLYTSVPLGHGCYYTNLGTVFYPDWAEVSEAAGASRGDLGECPALAFSLMRELLPYMNAILFPHEFSSLQACFGKGGV